MDNSNEYNFQELKNLDFNDKEIDMLFTRILSLRDGVKLQGNSYTTNKEIIEKINLKNLFVYIGFYFFFVCVAIVLLRRFPLHKIIFGIVRLTRYITTKTYSIINRTRNTTVILESHGSQIHSTDM